MLKELTASEAEIFPAAWGPRLAAWRRLTGQR